MFHLTIYICFFYRLFLNVYFYIMSFSLYLISNLIFTILFCYVCSIWKSLFSTFDVLKLPYFTQYVPPDPDSNTEDDNDSAIVNDFEPNRLMQHDNMNNTIEHMPLFSQRTRYYEIETKIELVDMARIFFNDTGRVLFFLCFAIYLYGDLSIYAAAVAKTMRDVIW